MSKQPSDDAPTFAGYVPVFWDSRTVRTLALENERLAALLEEKAKKGSPGRKRDDWVTEGARERFKQDPPTKWSLVFKVPSVAEKISQERAKGKSAQEVRGGVRTSITLRHARDLKKAKKEKR
jgi:hypothetical protein